MQKDEEFKPDHRCVEKETQLPIMGSEFPGLPIEATEKPKSFFGNLHDNDTFDQQRKETPI